MHPPEPAASAEIVANLTARLAAAERALVTRDKTIQALVTREKDRTAKRPSTFGVMEDDAGLQQVVTRKTLELEAQNRKLEETTAALQETSSLLDALMENTPAYIYFKDEQSRFVRFSKSLQDAFRLSDAAGLKGKTDFDFFDESCARESLADEQAILRTGEPMIGKPEKLRHADGRDLWSLTTKMPWRDKDGRIIGTFGISADLTAIKATEAELEAAHTQLVETSRLAGEANARLQNEVGERERAQSFLNSVVENLPIPVFIKEARELRFVLWNKAGEKLTGIPNAEMIGKNDYDFFPEKDAERNVAKDRAAFEKRGVLEIPEEIIQTRDHGARSVRVWKVPIFDAAGLPAFLLGIAEDITDRKRAEAALAEASNLMETFLENSPDLIYFKDRESRFLRYSKGFQRCFGLADFGSLHHKTDFDIFDEAHARPAYEDEQEIIRTGQPIIGKAEKEVWLDGRVTWALTSKLPWRDAQGRTIGTFGISKDITALKEAEAKLEQTHKQLLETSRLAGMAEVAINVLHNVGNVLNSVNISTGLIVERVKKSRASGLGRVVALLREHPHDLGEFITQDAKGKQLPVYLAQLSEHLAAEQVAMVGELDSLRQNVEHIKEIVAMQQSYATVGGVKEIVNVVNLVEDSLRMNEGALSRHGVAIIREFSPMPPLNVEKHKILQIVLNLLRNAKHACEDSERTDKQMTVRVANGAGWIKISVRDNGVGIPAENLTRIFNHGFTTKKDGHGFGLHSGALAAKEMGGSLTVQSAGPGQGATFTLELPLANGGELT